HVDRPRAAFAAGRAAEPAESRAARPRLPLLLRLLVHAPVRPELVVLPALVRIAEHFVRFVDLFELPFGRLVARVHVGMMLARQLPVGLLQFLVGRGLRDAERGVVVLEFHIQTPDLKTRSTACPPYKPTSSVMRSISCMSRRRASRPVVSLFIRGRRRRTASAIVKSRCTPARFTPSSSTRCLMTFRRSSSSRDYTRMLLVLLEGLLSADNALVLAVMILGLARRDQKKALRYGLVGAFAFRILATLLATYLIRIEWVKLLGGLYLLHLSYRHFFRSGGAE